MYPICKWRVNIFLLWSFCYAAMPGNFHMNPGWNKVKAEPGWTAKTQNDTTCSVISLIFVSEIRNLSLSLKITQTKSWLSIGSNHELGMEGEFSMKCMNGGWYNADCLSVVFIRSPLLMNEFLRNTQINPNYIFKILWFTSLPTS